jgi:hypothetical protein
MGFKQIYGDTVYGLFDYKMDFARKLLDSGSYNEVGLKIGYSTEVISSPHSKEICYHTKKILNVNNPNT